MHISRKKTPHVYLEIRQATAMIAVKVLKFNVLGNHLNFILILGLKIKEISCFIFLFKEF